MRRFYTQHVAKAGDFEEDKHPRAPDGKFGPGDGSGSAAGGEHAGATPHASGVTDAHRARARVSLADYQHMPEHESFAAIHATRLVRAEHIARAAIPLTEHEAASLKSKEFMAPNRERVIAAADAVREHYSRDIRAGDTVHDLAQGGIRGEVARIHAEQGDTTGSHAAREAAGQQARVEEAARIHVENDAHGGDHDMEIFAANEHSRVGFDRAGTPEEAHVAAMAAIDRIKRSDAEEQSRRDNENHAIAAGHITTAPRDVVDAYAAQLDEHAKAADEHIGALHDAHAKALDALGALNAHSHEEITDADGETVAHALELEHAHPDALAEEFSQTHSELTDPSGASEAHTYDEHEQHDAVAAPEPEHGMANEHVHPDKSDDWKEETPHPDDPELGDEFKPKTPEEHATMLAEHNEEHAARLADHEQWKTSEAEFRTKLAEHHDEFKRRAETAQAALEDLHAKQVAAHVALKEITAKSEKAHATAIGKLEKMDEHDHVNETAFEHHAEFDEETIPDNHPFLDESHSLNNDDWHYADPAVETSYRAALQASSSLDEHQRNRLDELGSHDFSEGLGSLHTEMKSTAAAIKELSKHTGRAPKLSGKTKKGLKRRRRRIYTSPDGGAAAMAAGY